MGEILVKKGKKKKQHYFHCCLGSLEEHLGDLCWDLCCFNLLLNYLEK